jgi:hypothetical protein
VKRDFFMEPPGWGKHARKFYLWGVCGSGKLTPMALGEASPGDRTDHRPRQGRLWPAPLLAEGRARGRHARGPVRGGLQPALADALDRGFLCLDAGGVDFAHHGWIAANGTRTGMRGGFFRADYCVRLACSKEISYRSQKIRGVRRHPPKTAKKHRKNSRLRHRSERRAGTSEHEERHLRTRTGTPSGPT